MSEERFISSIFNYCDRWCERCPFTTRCRVYAREEKLTDAQKDINNKAYWENIADSFAQAMQMIQAEAERLGIDLNDPEQEEETLREIEEQEKALEENYQDLTDNTLQYGKLIDNWWENENVTEVLKSKGVELQQLYQMGIGTPENDIDELEQAIKVIQWYGFFIHTKTRRALSGLVDNWDFKDPIQNDENGSAKIALIAIQRSMGAWEILRQQLPDLADDLLDFLVLLEKIKRRIIELFPNAKRFHRPGFDD